MKTLSSTNSTDETINALIVEDDLFFQNAICEALKACKNTINARLVSNASEALAILDAKATPIDLVLVDLGLPDLDGMGLIKTIRSRRSKLPCMVISTSSERDRVLEALREGASGYIIKGDVTISITQAVDLVLSGRSPISPELTTYLIEPLQSRAANSLSQDLGLTGRERELLAYFSSGHSYKRCAELMGVSLSTVQSHTRNLYRKLGVRSSLQAVLKAKGKGAL